MKRTLGILFGMLLVLAAVATAAEANDLGGKISYVGTIANINPCDGATVSGNVNVTASVRVAGNPPGLGLVTVNQTYQSSDQTGTDGITYTLTANTTALFDNLLTGLPSYTLPELQYYYVGKSLIFIVQDNATVLLNSSQAPTEAVSAPVTASICVKEQE
jgi:hypothetical protein